MMHPFEQAWSVLKSRPVGPSGEEYSPAELQRLRAFVNANIESPDPQLQAQAQQILEELTTAMSFAGGRTGMSELPGPSPKVAAEEPVPMFDEEGMTAEGAPATMEEEPPVGVLPKKKEPQE